MMERLSLFENAPAPVLVVGSIAFDTVRTPFACGERIMGGSATYAALAASYFAPVRLVGIVGNDFQEAHMDRFVSHGIDIEGLERSEDKPTFFWEGRYHDNFNKRDTLATELNAFADFQPRIPRVHRSSRFVLLGNIQPDLQLHVLNQLEGENYVLADSMNLWIDRARKDLEVLISRVDCFVVNDAESIELTGEPDVIKAGRALLRKGPGTIIVKKGEHGALLFHGEELIALPAFPVTEVIDPTGAGDSFAGAFMGFLAAGGNTDLAFLKKAMAYAIVTSSLTVEAFSLDRLENAGSGAIENRFAAFRQMVNIG